MSRKTLRVVCHWCDHTVTSKPKGKAKLAAHVAKKHADKKGRRA